METLSMLQLQDEAAQVEASVTEQASPEGQEAALRAFAALERGDCEALTPLYDTFAGEIYGLALWRTGSPDTAADVVQDVFVRLATRRERLSTVRDPRAFVLKIAHRLAIDRVRARQRRPLEPLETCPFLEPLEPRAETELDAARARRALARLPDGQREVIYLHDFLGLSFAAAARIAGVPTFTAATRYRLGIAKLRRFFGVTP